MPITERVVTGGLRSPDWPDAGHVLSRGTGAGGPPHPNHVDGESGKSGSLKEDGGEYCSKKGG